MESSVLKKYLEEIEEFVFIEDKIVSYLWLCQKLNIHVNTAKQLLSVFSQKDEFKNKLLITHILGGHLDPDGTKVIKLINSQRLEETKKDFKNINLDHVFSIQKSNHFSPQDIYNSNPVFYLPDSARELSSIRPGCPIEKRNIKVPIVEDVPAKVQKTTNQTKTVNNKDDSKTIETAKKSTTKSSSVENEKSKETPSSKNSPQKITKKASPHKNKKNTGKQNGASISSFFNRQGEIKREKNVIKKDKTAEVENVKETKEIEGCSKDSSKTYEHSEQEIKEVEEKEKASANNEKVNGPSLNSNKKGAKNKKRKKKGKSQENENNDKKRRRIVSVFSSSEESEEEVDARALVEEQMEIDEEPPEPVVEEEEDMIPPTPVGRKRVRKQVDKVFTDEDGFLLTKKEYVYESCTDDEGVDEGKENSKKNINNDKSKEINKDNENKEKESEEIMKENESKVTNKKSKEVQNIASKGTKKPSPKTRVQKAQASITNFFKKK